MSVLMAPIPPKRQKMAYLSYPHQADFLNEQKDNQSDKKKSMYVHTYTYGAIHVPTPKVQATSKLDMQSEAADLTANQWWLKPQQTIRNKYLNHCPTKMDKQKSTNSTPKIV